MSFKASFTLKLRPIGEITKEVMVPVATKMVKAAQEVVGNAARSHPYTDRTGNNTKRIGWALSAPGATTFGSLTTNAAGSTGTDGANPPDRRQLNVIVASTSGYGGYLEIGTRKTRPFPHIRPAWERVRPGFLRSLKGIV